MIGEKIIVCTALFAVLFATTSCVWFARKLWKDHERFEAISFCFIGVLLFSVVVGMFTIYLEKGF